MHNPTRRLPYSSFWDPRQSAEAHPARAWLAHVEAERIGTRVKPSREQLRRHVRNELVLLGYRDLSPGR